MEIFYNTLFPKEEIFFPTSDFTVLHSDPASPYATVRETKGFEPGTVSCILPKISPESPVSSKAISSPRMSLGLYLG